MNNIRMTNNTNSYNLTRSINTSGLDNNYNQCSDIKVTDSNIVVENGDVVIDNHSVLELLKKLEERLALLTPNPELESDWEELKNLGNQYRELEKKILEKEKTWQLLKK